MTDTFSSSKRREIMQAIKGKHTQPELMVRRILRRLRYPYRLHNRKLPGTPDFVFSKRRKVIFIHGCYWHRHSCKKGRSLPQTRTIFWSDKFRKNQKRDRSNLRKLKALGWEALILWECQLIKSTQEKLAQKIVKFLRRKPATRKLP